MRCRSRSASEQTLADMSARSRVSRRRGQPVEGSLTYGISEQLAELFRGNEGNTLGAEIARRALPAPNCQQHH